MKVVFIFLLAVLFSSQLSSQSLKKENYPHHTLIMSYTNAITGATNSDLGKNSDLNRGLRYGLSVGINYQAQLSKWFGLGTGVGFILHRTFSSRSGIIATGVPSPYNLIYYEKIIGRGIMDIPFNLVFLILKKEKIGVAFCTKVSGQILFYQTYNENRTWDNGSQRRWTTKEVLPFSFKNSLGIGIEFGPRLKVGKETRIVLQPVFQLIGLTNSFDELYEGIRYLGGLKTAWCFNLN